MKIRAGRDSERGTSRTDSELRTYTGQRSASVAIAPIQVAIANSPRQLRQRAMVDGIRAHLRGLPTMQLTKNRDFGGANTKKWYGDQISATNTSSELESVVKSMGEDSGVFLSDDIKEMEQWLGHDSQGGLRVNELVVPNREAIEDDQSNFVNLPDKFKNNGLNKDQNTAVIAEHELVHLKHAHSNLKQNVEGAGTSVGDFDVGSIDTTVDGLIKEAGDLEDTMGSYKVDRLENAKKYLGSRLEYISSTWKKKKNNAEAPAVLRELSRYLAIILKGNEHAGWAAFRDRIYAFDRACAKAINMPPAQAEQRGLCFLTTACTRARGLPDDCRELTVLREFRDGYLLAQSDGVLLIDAYYKHAPTIVHAIHRRWDEEELLALIYGVVEACVAAIEAGNDEFALQMYCEMMLILINYFEHELPPGVLAELEECPRILKYSAASIDAASPVARLQVGLAAAMCTLSTKAQTGLSRTIALASTKQPCLRPVGDYRLAT